MITILIITAVILLAIFIELAVIGYSISRQLEQQHRELVAMIDSLATMVGEAIEQNREK